MEIDQEVLEGDTAGPPGDGGGDRGTQGNVSPLLVYVKIHSSVYSHRTASKATRTLPSSFEPPSASLQRLNQSERSFSVKLDKLLHDEKYVGGLLGLPEDKLIQVANYLDDVSFPPVE